MIVCKKEEEEEEEEEEDLMEIDVKSSYRKMNSATRVPVASSWLKKRKRSDEKKRRRKPISFSDECVILNSPPPKKLYTSRWTTDRYRIGEEFMFKVLKEEGAVGGTTITRPKLRSCARKYIGDTGLLDHLLKHMDGKVSPSSPTHRVRRRHNFLGIMEYWLEDARFLDIRLSQGIQDPFWVPPPGWSPGDNPLSPDFLTSVELKLLKEEMATLKRYLEEIVSKKRDEDQANATPTSSFVGSHNIKTESSSVLHSHEEMLTKFTSYKAKMDQQLMEISTTLITMQENYGELGKWKAIIEQKLKEVSNSLDSVQLSKGNSSFNLSTSESWKNWFETTELLTNSEELAPWLDNGELIDLKREDFVPWFGACDLVDIKPEPVVCSSTPPPCYVVPSSTTDSQNPLCVNELDVLKQELVKIKSEIQELKPKKQEELSEMIVSSDSSDVTHPKFDLDNSLQMLQDMYKEVVDWKAKIEQQVTQISNTLSSLQS